MKRATRLRKRVLLFMSCFSVTILLVEHGSWRARSARQRQQGIPQARSAAPMQAKQHVLEHADALKPSAKIYPAGRCNQRRCAPAALLLRLQPLTAMRNDQWPDDIRLSDVEPRFTCQACGTKGADLRPNFHEKARQAGVCAQASGAPERST